LPSYFYCKHTDSKSIEETMDKVLNNWCWLKSHWAMRGLKHYNKKSVKIWTGVFWDWDEAYGL
jgi:hypothetical protein